MSTRRLDWLRDMLNGSVDQHVVGSVDAPLELRVVNYVFKEHGFLLRYSHDSYTVKHILNSATLSYIAVSCEFVDTFTKLSDVC